jgi:hypothetical protein
LGVRFRPFPCSRDAQSSGNGKLFQIRVFNQFGLDPAPLVGCVYDGSEMDTLEVGHGRKGIDFTIRKTLGKDIRGEWPAYPPVTVSVF